MSDPLPVQQQDVGPLAESLVGRDEGRCFAKAEQAGNVGKTRFSHEPDRSTTSSVPARVTTTAP